MTGIHGAKCCAVATLEPVWQRQSTLIEKTNSLATNGSFCHAP